MEDYEEQQLPCSEKLAFDSAKEAEAASLVATMQRGIVLSVYECQFCGLWHLSSS